MKWSLGHQVPTGRQPPGPSVPRVPPQAPLLESTLPGTRQRPGGVDIEQPEGNLVTRCPPYFLRAPRGGVTSRLCFVCCRLFAVGALSGREWLYHCVFACRLLTLLWWLHYVGAGRLLTVCNATSGCELCRLLTLLCWVQPVTGSRLLTPWTGWAGHMLCGLASLPAAGRPAFYHVNPLCCVYNGHSLFHVVASRPPSVWACLLIAFHFCTVRLIGEKWDDRVVGYPSERRGRHVGCLPSGPQLVPGLLWPDVCHLTVCWHPKQSARVFVYQHQSHGESCWSPGWRNTLRRYLYSHSPVRRWAWPTPPWLWGRPCPRLVFWTVVGFGLFVSAVVAVTVVGLTFSVLPVIVATLVGGFFPTPCCSMSGVLNCGKVIAGGTDM